MLESFKIVLLALLRGAKQKHLKKSAFCYDVKMMGSENFTPPQEKQKVLDVLSTVDTIIFDMDGLMIDSEPLHQQAYDKVLKRFGKGLSEEENAKLYVGISDKDASEDLVRRLALPVGPVELESEKNQAYLEMIGHVEPQPGLIELLSKLTKYKKAVASSSTLNQIELVVNELHAKGYFSGLFSAQQVEHGKPAPDIFLLAAQSLGSDPTKCLVLDDAPSGIAAANAASMYSFAIPSRETKAANFSNATVKLGSLVELAELIK